MNVTRLVVVVHLTIRKDLDGVSIILAGKYIEKNGRNYLQGVRAETPSLCTSVPQSITISLIDNHDATGIRLHVTDVLTIGRDDRRTTTRQRRRHFVRISPSVH